MYEYKTLAELTKQYNASHLPSPTKIFSSLNRERAEFFKRQMQDKTSAIYKATVTGRKIHTALETDNAHTEFERAVLRKFRRDIGVDIDETWAKEMGLISRKKRFRGKFDGVGVFRGRETVWDYKKVNRMKTPLQCLNYVKQCAAYAIAHDEMYGTKIDQIAIMLIAGTDPRELKTEVYVFDGSVLRQAKREFTQDVRKFEMMV